MCTQESGLRPQHAFGLLTGSLLGMVLIPKLAHCSRQRSLQRCPQCSFFSHMEVQSFLDSFFPHSIFTLCPHFGITFSTSILERKAV
ncbi:hypothetical protein OUZ56_010991 [Daphnia magna]|uniref:Secreted protein n=1 Tax=Daphnia magna TaxID=35525 RepID=A0ABQ9YZE6_9CRUS|nr:hypothetical protein OUZ56_010991 [Daphnia magna]